MSPFALILAHLVLGLNLASISNSVPIEVTDQLAKTKPSEFVAEESLFKDEEEEVVETAYVVGPDQIAVESKELLSSLEKDEIMPETLLEKAQALVEAQLVPRAGEDAAADSDSGRPLSFFIRTTYLTVTETETAYATRTTYRTCYTAEEGIENCQERKRRLIEERGKAAAEVGEIKPTRLIGRKRSLLYKSAELKEALQETSDSVKVVPIPTIEDEVIMDIIQLREEEEEKEGNHESEIEVVIVEDEPFVLENPVLKTEPLALEINNREEEVSDGETPQTDLVHEETLDLRNGGGEKPTVAVQEDNADEGLLEEEIVSVLSEVIHPTKVEKVEEIDEEEDSSDLSLRHPGNSHPSSPVLEDSLGGFNWVERQISGLNQDCFDPRDIAQRFLTLIETRIVLYTTTSTIYEAHPDMQTVSFASKNACLPSNVEGLFERCGK